MTTEPIAFVHDTAAQRVVLAAGEAAVRVRTELERLAAPTVMTIAGERSRAIVDAFADVVAVQWTEVVQHVPVDLARRARAAAAAAGVDTVVAVGGGSAVGLAKAVAMTRPVTIVAVPTTYAGSEATDVWGLTDADGKRTGVDPAVLPASVVYDPTLVAQLPWDLVGASGLNAVAHCVDALWAPRADPINAALATEALRALRDGLLGQLDRRGDLAACARTQYGSYLAAVAFASAGSAMHHKICHVLGGRFGLPHAATHAVVLPYVLGWNGPAAPEATRRIATALGTDDADSGLQQLQARLGAPTALRDLGLRESDIALAARDAATVIPPTNPRPTDAADLERLLHAAWAGEPAIAPATEPTR